MSKFVENYYAVNGIRLHTVECGKGPVLLFLHGFPEFWYGWKNQLTYFADQGFRAIAPDQRGYNLSDKPEGISAYNIEVLVEDIVQLIKTLGEPNVYLVGHDWGGGVAWTLAYLHPELVSKLIILNMPYPGILRSTMKQHWEQIAKSWYVGFFQLPWLPEKITSLDHFKMLASSLQNTALPGTFSEADLDQYRQAWQQPGSIQAMINWYRATREGNPIKEDGPGVLIPVLLIWGEKDQFLIPELAEASISKCAKGMLIKMPEATHWLHHEKSKEVNEKILFFITKPKHAL
jgi:pimeloyl-ACP methyl ester carboxylesterase